MTSYEVIHQYNYRVILLKTARIYVTEILFQTVNFYIFLCVFLCRLNVWVVIG